MDADATLRALATIHGVGTDWRDTWGQHRQVDVDVLRALLLALGVDAGTPASAAQSLAAAEAARSPGRLPPLLTAEPGEALLVELALPLTDPVRWTIMAADGSRHDGIADVERFADGRTGLRIAVPAIPGYGRLALEDSGLGETELAIAPAACPPVPRCGWGVGVQVYGLPGDGADDLGHCGALARFCAAAAAVGADAVAVSPMHAPFTADASAYSPYAPSNRQFLNGLLAEPSLRAGARTGDDAPGGALLRYDLAIPGRLAALRRLFDTFERVHLAVDDALAAEFRAFRAAHGAALEAHADFEALHTWQFGANPAMWDWRNWPAALRRPESDAVRAFAAQHAGEITFHVFLQWLIDRQLASAQRQARDGGMAIGLIADLAVGTHPAGSRAWSDGAALLHGASIGAPPDLLAPLGQNWGLTTFAPNGLAATGFAAFRADLRTAMRHAGGVRLDHIMGLRRVWCIPAGAPATCGAYVRMPWTDLARLTALEAHRHDCIVIGEDLGTLPEGFHDQLTRRNLLGMRVLWFAHDNAGRFLQPAEYPRTAVAMTSTHDLPTVVGWWTGLDITWRERLGLFDATADVARLRAERHAARAALWVALQRAGKVADPAVPEALDTASVAAIVGFLADTPAPLVLLPIEDLLMLPEQPNLPGTTTQHPNWRRRLGQAVTGLFDRPPASTILRSLAARHRDPA